MPTTYEEVKAIHDQAVRENDPKQLLRIVPLLNGRDIKIRQRDGKLLWTTLSVPRSVGETIVIGWRYLKDDQTLTEDLFEVNRTNPDAVSRHYRGALQGIHPEYSGTHKEQNVARQSWTSVNTCCLYIGP